MLCFFMFYVMLSINPPSKNKPVQKLIAKYVFDCYEKRRSLVLQVNIDYSFTSAMCVMILNYLDEKSMYIGLCRTPNKALSCLVSSCLVYQRVGVSGLSAGQNIGDLTIRQRIYVDVHEIVAEKKTSQPFKLNHYYPKSPSSLKDHHLMGSW